jgi:hypothetical protein
LTLFIPDPVKVAPDDVPPLVLKPPLKEVPVKDVPEKLEPVKPPVLPKPENPLKPPPNDGLLGLTGIAVWASAAALQINTPKIAASHVPFLTTPVRSILDPPPMTPQASTGGLTPRRSPDP